MITPNQHQTICELIKSRRTGYGLSGDFYRDSLLYHAELERIWRRGWLFAGHTCQIPEPGDYFTFEIDNDSLIVVRDDEGNINALHNGSSRASFSAGTALGGARP